VVIAAFLVVGTFVAPKAEAGDVVAVCGPTIINEGDTEIYVAQIDSIDGDVEVDLNDISGDSNITSELRFDSDGAEADDEWEYVELDDETDFLSDAEVFNFANEFTFFEDGPFFEFGLFSDVEDIFEAIEADFDVDLMQLFLEDCGEDDEGFIEDVEETILECIKGEIEVTEMGDFGFELIDFDFELVELDEVGSEKCDEDDYIGDPDDEDVTLSDIGMSPTEFAEEIAQMLLDDTDLLFDCEDLFEEVNEFLVDLGVESEYANAIANDMFQLCTQGEFFGDIEGFVLVDVTCDEAGNFDLSFEPNQDDSEPGDIEVQCVGDVDEAEIEANPTTIEIIPAVGSSFASLVTLNLLDADGEASGNGTTIVWTTDKCQLSADFLAPDEDDPDALMIEEALEVFGEFNRNTSSTAAAINAFVMDLDQETDDEVEAEAFSLDVDAGDFSEGDVISAVILDCSGTTNTPGIAHVMACIDLEGADICETANVTVVGPPVAPIVLTTDQTNVRCGERVQITATIKDAAGQNVSDHTLVEVVTNAGGVLGGTGAVAAEAGLVSPVSSTVGETVNGVATFWLITSELHQGTYTVLVTTGGGGAVASGGLFSTAPVSGSVTVTCAVPGGPTTTAPQAPSPAATVRAPSTGQGITPPSTGDAGLADASGGSWALFVIAGLTVFALAGVASLKAVRR
jgi:hypothetical protein